MAPELTRDAEAFGVYVHVPYCRRICPYCDFNVHLLRKALPWERLTDALLAEWQAHHGAFGAGPIASVYFGGGTPSLMPPAQVARVLEALARDVGVSSGAEITLEVDPGTVGLAALRELRALGVNRVSLGWQSTHDRLLRTLGRGHGAQDSRATYDAVREAGFGNVSIDLIFAVPGQTMDHLEADLRALIDIAPEHVSLYGLTYHEGTPFAWRRARGRLVPVSEELEVQMMARIESALAAAGWERYEVSNYARPGFAARHNGSYWDGVPYLGLGPGAHSFLRDGWQRGWRWEGLRQPEQYHAAWTHADDRRAPPEAEQVEMVEALDARTLRAERMMCGLRRVDGLSLDDPALREHLDELRPGIDEGIRRGWLDRVGSALRPTPRGLLFADDLGALWL